MLQYETKDNHFNLDEKDGVDDAMDTSYRQVVPKEYDYMSNSNVRLYN